MCNSFRDYNVTKQVVYQLDALIISKPPILKLIDSIRDSMSLDVCLYRHERSYQFALILRSQFNGELWHDSFLDKVYFKYNDKFYNIDGLCVNPPKHLTKLDHREGVRPHRWRLKEEIF